MHAERTHPGPRSRIACLSTAPWNPYLTLLYRHLAAAGIEQEPDARLSAGWLLGDARRRVRWLHVHWPESLYRLNRGPTRLRRPLSWVKASLFAGRLVLARVLGYRLVWTIHQLYPHEPWGRIDVVGTRIIARKAHVRFAHDDQTAERARRELRLPPDAVVVVPHGSYLGVYPPGRSRSVVRDELGVASAACLFLCFGELRGTTDIDVLLTAFSALDEDVALVVAGNAKKARAEELIDAAAARDARIRRVSGFVPVERVAELYQAADAAVIPRSDGGTSGSLILALSLGVPVVAADTPTYRSLVSDGGADPAGWLFAPGDSSSLAAELERVASTPEAARRELGRAALARASGLSWEESARRIAAALVG